MKDLLDDLDRWRAEGQRIAIARVVGLDGSGPRVSYCGYLCSGAPTKSAAIFGASFTPRANPTRPALRT